MKIFYIYLSKNNRSRFTYYFMEIFLSIFIYFKYKYFKRKEKYFIFIFKVYEKFDIKIDSLFQIFIIEDIYLYYKVFII